MTLRAAGVGASDEVITVSHTFVPTVAAIHHAGAMPILIDIGDDHNMDVELIEAAITPRTKAIMPVHLNGRLCNMERLMSIAGRHDLTVIEDAAQALGGSYKGIKDGVSGLAGCFSFYPAKMLGAYGNAGALVTNSSEIAEKVTLLRSHARTPDNDIAGWSFNCRLDNVQAALLSLKLREIPGWIVRQRELAPPPPAIGHRYDVFQNYEIEAENRDRLVGHLKDNGMEVLVSWGGKGVHQFPALGLPHFHLPRTEHLFSGVVRLLLHCELTNQQVEYVCQTIQKFYTA